MLKQKFDLQLFSEEEGVEEPVVDESMEAEEPTEEMPSEEEDTVEAEPDYTDADKSFLERFEIQFNKNPKRFETIEELKEAAEMGSALPRYKEKLSELEAKTNSPHYKWLDEYMKVSGYEDGAEFVKAIRTNEKYNEYVKNGMSEEAAQKEAEEYVSKAFGNQQDKRTRDMEGFVNWHQGKFEAGTFTEELDPNNLPKSVIDAYENGESMKEAYTDHLLMSIKTETEQNTLKKLAKNKETSTGELKAKASDEATLSHEKIEQTLSALPSSEKSKWIEKNWKMIEKSGYFN